MSLDVGDLTAFLKLDTGPFDRESAAAEGKFGAFGGRLGKIAVAAGVAVAAALGTAAYKGVQAFAEFETGMNEVFTLMPGISGEAMGEMSDQVKDFSRDFGVLPNDVIPALYQSLSAGVPPDNVFDFLETAQMAAKGGVTDLTTAVDGISSVVNSYGAEVMDAATASDMMFTAVRLGKTNFEELSGSLYNVLPTASALGVGFEDITAAMAQMTSQGVPTSVATTQMRQLLVELSKDGGKASEAFTKIAGEGFADFIAGGGDVAGALDIMQQAADDNGVALQDMFGSVEAGAAALGLAADGTDAYRGSIEEMIDSTGATTAAYEQMDQGLAASWSRIKAAGAVALIDLGEKLAPFVGRVADLAVQGLPMLVTGVDHVGSAMSAAGDVVGAVTGFMGDHQTALTITAGVILTLMIPALIAWGVQSTIAGAKSVAAFLLARVAAVQSAALHVISLTLIAAGWVATGTQAVVSAALIVGGWVASGAAATASAARQVAAWMIQRGPMIATAAMAGINFAIIAGGWVMAGISAMAGAAVMAAAWLVAIWPIALVVAAIAGVVALVVIYWDEIVAFTVAAWDWVVGLIRGAIDTVVGIFLNFTGPGLIIKHWETIKSTVSAGVGSVVSFVSELPGKITNALTGAAGWLVGVGEDVMNGLVAGIDKGFQWVKDKLSGVGNLIPGWLKSVLGISSPSKVMRDQVGQWIPAGVADGILAGLPLVEDAMAQLAVVPDVHVPMPAGITAPRVRGGDGASLAGDTPAFPVQLNIHPTPGLSEQQIGTAAADQLAFHMRARG